MINTENKKRMSFYEKYIIRVLDITRSLLVIVFLEVTSDTRYYGQSQDGKTCDIQATETSKKD